MLDGRGGRVERVELDDPTEAVGLVRGLRQVEALVDVLPPLALAGDAVPLVGIGLLGVERAGGVEVTVEVLLAVQRRAPRRGAAGAVGEGAEDRRALGVSLGAQQLVTSGGAVDAQRRAGRDAAVVARAARVAGLP